MASLIKRCECADRKAGRKLNLRTADDRKIADKLWNKCAHSWVLRYRPGGRGTKQTEASYPHEMKRDAEEFGRRVESAKVTHLKVTVDPKAGAVLFRTFADEWVQRFTGKPGTFRTYRGYLTNQIYPILGERSLSSIRTDELQALVKKVKTERSVSVARGVVSVLRRIFEHAVLKRLIAETPFQDIATPKAPPRKEVDVPEWVQVKAIANAMPEQWRPIVWLMAGAGLRIDESLAFHRDCIRPDRLRIHEQYDRRDGLTPLKHREGGESRDMPLPAYLRDILTDHMATHGTHSDGYLFAGEKATFVVDDTFRKRFNDAVKAAGIKTRFTPHDLRHTFASRALNDGVRIDAVARWLGHKDINETYKTYAHLLPDEYAKAAKVLDAAYREAVPAAQAA
ncbi:tyrosine-type recombinase/integrase [Nonomuraea sp. NPDC050790]|uniref:tyrosine-type recombinase/integrase n=1 Tax=Nonomuraea sp. NPDC050790 TaxID=3364371 RepID=UPI00379B194B